jgi:ABC-type sulfate transport system substrate-binding protein
LPGSRKRREKVMDMTREQSMAKIAADLWSENLWFRRLNTEDQDAIARVIHLVRTNHIRGMKSFESIINQELTAILANPKSFGITERQEVPHA